MILHVSQLCIVKIRTHFTLEPRTDNICPEQLHIFQLWYFLHQDPQHPPLNLQKNHNKSEKHTYLNLDLKKN